MRVWPESTITAALTLASIEGEAVVTCADPSSAARFRTAIYNFCRRKNHSNGSGRLSITLSGADVILRLRKPEKAILQRPGILQ